MLGKELSDIKKWVEEDIKEAQFELNGYVIMRDLEMINYWKKIIKYFRNFVSNIITFNLEQIKRDYRLGDDAEQYAAELILCRLGVRI